MPENYFHMFEFDVKEEPKEEVEVMTKKDWLEEMSFEQARDN